MGQDGSLDLRETRGYSRIGGDLVKHLMIRIGSPGRP